MGGRVSGPGATLTSERLVLRPWRPEDREPFAALNADPEVMRFFPAVLSRTESDAVADRIEAHFSRYGYGFWAVEIRGGAPFVGFTGLAEVTFDVPFAPATEVGWRLAREHWGRGYATEAGHAALRYAFETLGREEVVAFAVAGNARSRAVMERLGMTHDEADDFEHPALPPGHPLRQHVLSRLTLAQWTAAGGERRP